MGKQVLKDKRLHVIFGITIIAVMGVASITPALPKMSEILDLSKTQTGLLISAFTFPGIFLTPVAGVIADRIGRKNVIVPSLFIFAFAGFAIFFVHKFHYIILLRIVQGIGASSLGSLNTTLVGDIFKGKKLPEAMGYNAGVLSISTAFYPLIGGLLAAVAWYYPFVMPLLAVPVALFVMLGIDEPEIVKPTGFRQYLINMSGSVLRKNVIAVFLLGIITFTVLYGAFLTYLPFLLHQKFSLASSGIGIFMSLSSVTTAVVASQVGRLTSKFGSFLLLKVAFILYFIVTLLFPFIGNLYLIIVPVLLFGAAQGLNIPSLQTILARLAPDNQRGAFMSLNGMMIRIGQTTGPMLIGLGYLLNGLDGAFYFGAAAALTGLIVTLTMLKKTF